MAPLPEDGIRLHSRSILAALLAALLLALGCVDAYGLLTLRRALAREFHHEEIGVSVTDGLALTVTFVNQLPADAPCDTLTAFALRVASFVSRTYPGFDTLQVVNVAFAYRGPDDTGRPTSSHLPFRFSRAALRSGELAAESAGAEALCALDLPEPRTDEGRDTTTSVPP